MAPTRTARKAAPAPAPEVESEEEFEELEDATEDDDLEEMEDGEDEPAEAPKPKAKKATATKKAPPARPKIEFGSPWLAAYVTEKTGETFDSRAIRMLLRRLAKDGKLEREVGVSRERYEFTGPNDPIVKAVIGLVNSGEAKAMKQEGLQKVKDNAAAKKAAAKAAKEAEAESDEMEVEDEDEIEEAPPAPKPTRRAPAKAAPAKATPATRRRAAPAAK